MIPWIVALASTDVPVSEPGLVGIILAVAAVVAAMATIWKYAIRPMIRAANVVHKTYEKVNDTEARLAVVEDRSAQLLNNSGSSLRDAVDRIEANQGAQSRAFADHVEWGQAELLKVWQNLASRDAVEAAAKTAEMLERGN